MNQAIRKLTIITAAFASLGAAGTSAATPGQALYGNELDRCVSAVRDQVADENARRIRYLVSGVKKDGAWYEFAIRTELFHAEDGPAVSVVDARCRAHRWDTATRVAL